MDNILLVKSLVDRILLGEDLAPVVHLLADDVVFKVAVADDPPLQSLPGKEAMVEYFRQLGDIVAFWRVQYSGEGEHVLVLGRESFTIGTCDIDVESEFALVFDVYDGLITRFMVVEDLSAFIKDAQLTRLRRRLETALEPAIESAGVKANALVPA
jgi:SnoaL-like protein